MTTVIYLSHRAAQTLHFNFSFQGQRSRSRSNRPTYSQLRESIKIHYRANL